MSKDVNKCPTFVLPDEWNDDDAMFFYMQSIKRPRHIDPDTYQRKVQFWTNLILSYARQQRVLVVNQRALKALFTRRFESDGLTLSPQCLGQALTALQETDQIQPYSDELSPSLVHQLVASTFEYLVKQPILAVSNWWGWSTTSATEPDLDKPFMFHKLADQMAASFLEWFDTNYSDRQLPPSSVSLSDRIFLARHFDSALTAYFQHDASRNLISRLLEHRHQCVKRESVQASAQSAKHGIIYVSDGLHNKINPSSSTPDSKATLAGLIELKAAMDRLEVEEQRLNNEILEKKRKIKQLLLANRRPDALALLKRLKPFQKSLDQKQQQLTNLEALFFQIQSASDHRGLVEALSGGAIALRKVTGGERGLKEAEETALEVAEASEDVNQVSNMLADLGDSLMPDIDQDELELELEKLTNPTGPKSADKGTDDLDAELAALRLVDQLPSPIPASLTPVRPSDEASSSLSPTKHVT